LRIYKNSTEFSNSTSFLVGNSSYFRTSQETAWWQGRNSMRTASRQQETAWRQEFSAGNSSIRLAVGSFHATFSEFRWSNYYNGKICSENF